MVASARLISFIKMQGAGNDYIFIDLEEAGHRHIDQAWVAAFAPPLSDRRFGIGSDGVILIQPSADADARMEIYNADGSRAQMCGNGIRCVARYLSLRDPSPKTPEEWAIESDSGIHVLRVWEDRVQVSMGTPTFDRNPLSLLLSEGVDGLGYSVSVGNHHVVVPCQSVEKVPLSVWGPEIENDRRLQNPSNVSFVETLDRSRIRVVTWERGSGITQACGTAATACATWTLHREAHARLDAEGRGLEERRIEVMMPGGALEIFWEGEGSEAMLEGPAEEVFRGSFDESSFDSGEGGAESLSP